MNGTPTHGSWIALRRRCFDPNNPRFEHYGARGITVCPRWLGRDGFANFLADMGERPAGASIDRINVDGNYEPSNCRWASRETQARNTRANKLEAHEPDQIRWLLAEGFTQTEIARFYEVSQSSISLIALGKTWREDAQ